MLIGIRSRQVFVITKINAFADIKNHKNVATLPISLLLCVLMKFPSLSVGVTTIIGIESEGDESFWTLERCYISLSIQEKKRIVQIFV
uniref:Uncharacterized protein n=1 Tax=Pyxicephalus adspersus TaxID=30357 RepID=A0AAV2ZG92_PYXAD|nr:TPA: hypothetical protein GDO54_005309 [Pyxicephalus adspersus]